MNKFEIFADSSQDFTFELAEQENIIFFPYYLSMGDNDYKDQAEMDNVRFYKTIKQYEKLSTGTPPSQEVLDKIEELKAQGATRALAVTSSADITGMANLYESINQMVEGFEIVIIDTGNIGAAVALATLEASRLRSQGNTIEEIKPLIEKYIKNLDIFAIFRELEYLVKGGRMSAVKAAIGGFLNISPILTVKNRVVDILDKPRGKKKSLAKLIQIVKDRIGNSNNYSIAIFQGDNQEEFEIVREELKDYISKAGRYIETILTPVLGVHSGPTALGIAVMILD